MPPKLKHAGWILTRDREQRFLGRTCLPIDEVHDRADMLADDGRLRLGGEIAYGRGMPVIASSPSARLVHSLLDDGPLTVWCEHERVEIRPLAGSYTVNNG